MHFASHLIDIILHLNIYLAQLVQDMGTWVYAIIFAIVFCETGLIITPFLPGDSLLFAAGSLSAISILNPHALFILIVLAAFMGDNANYWIGRWLGVKVFSPNARFLKTEYLNKTHAFYEKHGYKAIFLARYIPLFRTFVPFVGGLSRMTYSRYLIFSFLAAMLWSGLFIYMGYFFGNIPVIQQNFSLAILGVIVLSVSPAAIKAAHHFWQKRGQRT